MALRYGEDILVVDAGLMFPGATLPGVDLVIPDFSYLSENRDKIKGVILTHGHEDHIGALPFLMREIEAPVYGTRLTLALAQERLQEHKGPLPSLVEVKARQKLELGPFSLEFIGVSHSILDGLGLAVMTPAGTIIHTGDFKIDLSAPEEDRLDLFKFSEYGEKGVLALLSDSTNADIRGHSESEGAVGRALAEIFRVTEGRIILACFASSLARIRQVAKAASLAGRKILFDGRSMVGNVRMAVELGYLNLEEGAEVTFQEAEALDDRELVVVVTGSQGEPLSALARMASGEHRQISVRPGDTIIFSARVIPGNETAINTLMNQFHQCGANVLDPRYHGVHASGHGQTEELKLMLSLVRPHFFIPIHGELRHLIRHADLARESGLPRDRVFVLENGQRLRLWESLSEGGRLGGGSKFLGGVPTGRLLVDGNRLGSPEDPVIKSRQRLAEEGLAAITLVLSKETGALLCPPRAAIMGVHYASEADLTLECQEATRRLHEIWLEERGQGQPVREAEEEELSQSLRRELRSLFRHSINRRPAIWPQVILA
jgi:ribonuclease J